MKSRNELIKKQERDSNSYREPGKGKTKKKGEMEFRRLRKLRDFIKEKIKRSNKEKAFKKAGKRIH